MKCQCAFSTRNNQFIEKMLEVTFFVLVGQSFVEMADKSN